MTGPGYRRGWGLALVVLAVLAVTQVAARRPIPGSPIAAPIPPSPSIGDCLLDQPTGLGWDDWTDQGSPHPDDPPAGATIGRCDAVRYGEIVLVDTAAGTVDGQLSRWPECYRQATDYLGLPPADDDPAALWQATVTMTTGFVWPSRRQAAAGQTWVACVVAVLPEDPAEGGTDPVVHPLRGAWSVPDVRNRLGACGQDAMTFVPCGRPHRMEMLAVADLDSPTLTQEQLDQGCRDEVAEQTRMPDVTAGGSLSIATVIFVQRPYPAADSPDPVPDLNAARNLDPPAIYSFAHCLVSPTAPDRELVGSLRELGDAPVPFAT